ncbi:hypothetical protein, partial [Pseudactinotalea sp.]|uniref:hypothetical protein n=1 Tax=Pseudactinotalea sp. TaxID=1926260 RepID=UPI003B3A9B09
MRDAAAAERWDRWFTYLPFAALAVATVVAMVAGPHIGATTPTARLVAQLVLPVVVAVWLWWFTVVRPELGRERPWALVYYVVRTVMAFALTLLNPLFCIFGWVGYIDADGIFRRNARWVAVGATAVIMATGQSGGVPTEVGGQAALFAVLLVVNFGLAGVFSSYGNSMERSNAARAAAISELESLNA